MCCVVMASGNAWTWCVLCDRDRCSIDFNTYPNKPCTLYETNICYMMPITRMAILYMLCVFHLLFVMCGVTGKSVKGDTYCWLY